MFQSRRVLLRAPPPPPPKHFTALNNLLTKPEEEPKGSLSFGPFRTDDKEKYRRPRTLYQPSAELLRLIQGIQKEPPSRGYAYSDVRQRVYDYVRREGLAKELPKEDMHRFEAIYKSRVLQPQSSTEELKTEGDAGSLLRAKWLAPGEAGPLTQWQAAYRPFVVVPDAKLRAIGVSPLGERSFSALQKYISLHLKPICKIPRPARLKGKNTKKKKESEVRTSTAVPS